MLFRALQWFVWSLGRGLFALRYRSTVVGDDKVRSASGPFLILPNHPAYADPPNVFVAPVAGVPDAAAVARDELPEPGPAARSRGSCGRSRCPDIDRASAERAPARRGGRRGGHRRAAGRRQRHPLAARPAVARRRRAARRRPAPPPTCSPPCRTRPSCSSAPAGCGAACSAGPTAAQPPLIGRLLRGIGLLAREPVLLRPAAAGHAARSRRSARASAPEPTREAHQPVARGVVQRRRAAGAADVRPAPLPLRPADVRVPAAGPPAATVDLSQGEAGDEARRSPRSSRRS